MNVVRNARVRLGRWRMAPAAAGLVVASVVPVPLVASAAAVVPGSFAATPMAASAQAPQASTPPKCPKGTRPWKAQGVWVCRKTPPATMASPFALQAAQMLSLVTLRATPKDPAASPLLAAAVRSGPALLDAAYRAAMPAHVTPIPVTKRKALLPRAGDTWSQSVSDSMTKDGVTATVNGTVTISGVNAQGQATVTEPLERSDIGLGLSMGDTSIKISMTRTKPYEGLPRCPTIDGYLRWTQGEGGGMTVVQKSGNRVTLSKTIKIETLSRIVARVGANARLESVNSDTTSTTSIYGGGRTIDITSVTAGQVGRGGNGTPSGPVSTQVKFQSASTNAAQERAIADAIGKSASAAESADRAGQAAAREAKGAREQLLVDYEKGWYAEDNPCVRGEITPYMQKAPPNSSGTAQARFFMKSSGAQPVATWKVINNPIGKVNDGFSTGPGAGKVQWTAASSPVSADNNTTLRADYEVLSRAGRDVAHIAGEDGAPKIDVSITGSLGATDEALEASARVRMTFSAEPDPTDITNYSPLASATWEVLDATATTTEQGCTVAVSGTDPGPAVTAPQKLVHRTEQGDYAVFVSNAVMVNVTYSGTECSLAGATITVPVGFAFSTAENAMVTVRKSSPDMTIAGPTTFNATAQGAAGDPRKWTGTLTVQVEESAR